MAGDHSDAPSGGTIKTQAAGEGGNVPLWMDEALNTGNIGLWTILLDPLTGQYEMMGNDDLLRLLGLDAHPSPRQCYEHWFSRIDPGYKPMVNEALMAMLSGSQQHEVEYPWIHPRLGRIIVRCCGKQNPSPDSHLCLRGYHQNVTELYTMRQSLRENLARLETACRVAKLGVFELTPVGNALDLRANAIYAEQFGLDLAWPLDEIVNVLRERTDNFPADDWAQMLNPALWEPGKRLRREVTFRHPQRGERRFVIEYEFLIQPSEGGKRTVGFTQDITGAWRTAVALREAKESAEAANMAKSAFLANMSHEIRTPMNGIIGMASLLLGTELTPKQRDMLDKMNNLARSLLGVLNDILDFSKIEADRLELEHEPFQLSDLLDMLAGIVRIRSAGKGLEFTLRADPALPDWLAGDALRLRQVLLNLCDNAVKFTPKGRVDLEVRLARRTESQVLLEFLVRDEGIGMGKATQARLFQPFMQADVSTTRHFGGTGLGLAICHRLAEMMGGVLTVESQPGQGSLFRLEAPFALAEPETRQDEALPDVSGLHVLVAEDNDINREIVIHLLDSLGVRCEIAVNGQEAVDIFQRMPHLDGILMDLQMPLMDGYEATRRIREGGAPRAASVPIVALTANAMRGDAEKSLAAGMNGHLTKPVEVGDLAFALACWKNTTSEDAPRR